MTEVKVVQPVINAPKMSELKGTAVVMKREIAPQRKTPPQTPDNQHPFHTEGIFGAAKSEDDMHAGFVYAHRTNAMADFYEGKDPKKASELRQEATDIQELLLEKYKTNPLMINAKSARDAIVNTTDPTLQAQERLEAKQNFFKEQAEKQEQLAQNRNTRIGEEMGVFTDQEANAALLFLDAVPLQQQDEGYNDPVKFEQACVLAVKEFAGKPLDDRGLTNDAQKKNIVAIATRIYNEANLQGLSPFALRSRELILIQKQENDAKINEAYKRLAKELETDATKLVQFEQAGKFGAGMTLTSLFQEAISRAHAAGINIATDTDAYQNIVDEVRASHLRSHAESLMQVPSSFIDQNGNPDEAYRLKYHELTVKSGTVPTEEAITESLHQDAVAKDRELVKQGIERAYADVYLASADELIQNGAKLKDAIDNDKFDISSAIIHQEITDEIQANALNPYKPADAPAIDRIKRNIYANHLRKKTESSLQVPKDVDNDAYVLKWKQLYTKNNGVVPTEDVVMEALNIDSNVGNTLDAEQNKHIKYERGKAQQLADNEVVKQYFHAAEQVIDEIVAMRNDPANSVDDPELEAKVAPLRVIKVYYDSLAKKRALTAEEQAKSDSASRQISTIDEFLQKDPKAKGEERTSLQLQLRKKETAFQSYIDHIGTLRGMSPEFAQKIRTAFEDKWYRGDSDNWNELMKQSKTVNWAWLFAILGSVIASATVTTLGQGVRQAASFGHQQ